MLLEIVLGLILFILAMRLLRRFVFLPRIQRHRTNLMLAFLEQPRWYVWDLIQRIRASSGPVYVLLQKEEDLGNITSYWGEEIAGSQYQGHPLRRRLYATTPQGEQIFRERTEGLTLTVKPRPERVCTPTITFSTGQWLIYNVVRTLWFSAVAMVFDLLVFRSRHDTTYWMTWIPVVVLGFVFFNFMNVSDRSRYRSLKVAFYQWSRFGVIWLTFMVGLGSFIRFVL